MKAYIIITIGLHTATLEKRHTEVYIIIIIITIGLHAIITLEK